MPQWEVIYLQASTNRMDVIQDQANRLGALGWEPVGIASADKTIGINSNVLIMKREITSPPPPPATIDEWQDDPTGRYDKRRWDAAASLWTAEVATMATKELHVDPPRLSAS